MKVCRIAKNNEVGETSSKYGHRNGGAEFIKDCQKHEERHNYLWSEFVKFMKAHQVTPTELRSMFTKYYEEYLN